MFILVLARKTYSSSVIRQRTDIVAHRRDNLYFDRIRSPLQCVTDIVNPASEPFDPAILPVYPEFADAPHFPQVEHTIRRVGQFDNRTVGRLPCEVYIICFGQVHRIVHPDAFDPSFYAVVQIDRPSFDGQFAGTIIRQRMPRLSFFRFIENDQAGFGWTHIEFITAVPIHFNAAFFTRFGIPDPREAFMGDFRREDDMAPASFMHVGI